MGVLLEIKAGPFAGKKIAIVTGQTVTFGRGAGRAEFALPHDTFMSGVHFAVECGASGCRVQDRKSSNGTFLNGGRVADAMLTNGDEIKGGQTVFTVKVVPDAKLASLVPPQESAAPLSVSPPPAPRPPAPPPPTPPREVSAPVVTPPVVTPPLVSPRGAPIGDESRREAPPSASSRPSLGGEPPVVLERRPREPEPFVSSEQAPREAAPPSSSAAQPPPSVVERSRESADGAARSSLRDSGQGAARGSSVFSHAAAFRVMGWSFPAAPAEWHVQEGFGLQQSGNEGFPSSVAASEELLGGITLQQFVESQISMLRGYLRDPKIEPTMPPRVGGADESMAMDVRHSTKDGRELVYRRIYARSGPSVGVLTVTTLAAELPQVLQSLQPLLDGAAFRSTVNG